MFGIPLLGEKKMESIYKKEVFIILQAIILGLTPCCYSRNIKKTKRQMVLIYLE
jgi:hypothetical protein